jgi:hypothetical protein
VKRKPRTPITSSASGKVYRDLAAFLKSPDHDLDAFGLAVAGMRLLEKLGVPNGSQDALTSMMERAHTMALPETEEALALLEGVKSARGKLKARHQKQSKAASGSRKVKPTREQIDAYVERHRTKTQAAVAKHFKLDFRTLNKIK